MKHKFTRFVPFTKVDEEQRMVFGVATDETLDHQGEIVDYNATKVAVAEWRKWRNVREMHQPSAVGTAQVITLDDEKKALSVGVKVVDDGAWQKVKEGVYKGFSIGGSRLKTVLEKTGDRSLTRITEYLLTEISLVDRPANPNAAFSLVKREEDDETPQAEPRDDETPPAEPRDDETPPAEPRDDETPPAEPRDDESPPALDAARVKAIVVEVLKELGLVREELAEAGRVNDLHKQVNDKVVNLGDGLGKLVSDVAQIVQAVESLEGRLEKVEVLPAGSGPVLREIGMFGVANQGETVLKDLLGETNDPQLRQLIGQRLAELQIKAVQQSGGQRIQITGG